MWGHVYVCVCVGSCELCVGLYAIVWCYVMYVCCVGEHIILCCVVLSGRCCVCVVLM